MAAAGDGWIGRRELVLWVVAAILANQALHVLDLGTPFAFLVSVLSLNLVYLLAGIVIVSRVLGSNGCVVATRLEVALGFGALIAMAITGLVGYRMGIGVVSTAVALYALGRAGLDQSLRASGAVLLALSANLVWAPIFFQLVTPELLAADAFLVRGFLMFSGAEVSVNGLTFENGEGHRVTLVGACSSFKNLSMGLLAGVAITMALRTHFVRRDVVAIAAVCAIMALLNALRVVLLAANEASHLYWHDGNGAPILAMFQTALIVALAFIGAHWATRSAAS